MERNVSKLVFERAAVKQGARLVSNPATGSDAGPEAGIGPE